MEYKNKLAWMLIICVISFGLHSKSLLGAKPLASIALYQDLDSVKVSSFLMIYKNNSYAFKSNVGGWHFCPSERAGVFNGKINPTQNREIIKRLDLLKRECKRTNGCIEEERYSQSRRIVINDYRDKKKYVFIKEFLPKIFDYVSSNKLNTVKNPLMAYQIAKKRSNFEITNIGKKERKLIVSKDTIKGMNDKGMIVRLPDALAHEKSVKLGKNKKLHFHLNEKVLKKEKISYLIFDNITTAHHTKENVNDSVALCLKL